MIVCMNCSVEPLTNPKAKFCSDRCKKQWQRKNRDETQSGQPNRDKPERTAQGNIRVSKPGDTDYVPQCETTRAFIEGRDKRPETGKRGKDIKAFEDLPPHVQETIDMMSTTDGKLDKTVKANRTAIAINYQHQFPDQRWPHNELRLTPVGRVGDTVSEWEAANRKA